MTTISLLRCWLILLALSAGAAFAEDQPLVPAERFVYCTVCHGVQMGGNAVLIAPRLSGMEAWYVERQLRAFRNGWRGVHEQDAGGHEMRPMAAALAEKDLAVVARYVEAVTSAPPPATIDGDAERGKQLYQSCIACHGANGEGNKALVSPGLAGLNDWYLLTQLRNYKAGIRGSHPDDSAGRQMQAAAQLLADEQAMQDVVRYIATLTSQ